MGHIACGRSGFLFGGFLTSKSVTRRSPELLRKSGDDLLRVTKMKYFWPITTEKLKFIASKN